MWVLGGCVHFGVVYGCGIPMVGFLVGVLGFGFGLFGCVLVVCGLLELLCC